MSRINRADWTKERIAAFRKFLAGDQDAEYHGRKKNGEMYKKALKVRTLIAYYKGYTFSIGKGGKLMVSGEGHGPREVLTDEQVAKRAQGLYKHKETGLGKAPSIYQHMNKKYVNVSYRKVDRAIQQLPSYQKYQARHLSKPKARKIIVSKSPGEAIDADVMYFSKNFYRPAHNEGFEALAIVVDRFSGYIGIAPLKAGPGTKTADIVAQKTAQIINSAGFPKKQGGTIFHDGGVEYKEIFPEKMRQIGYNDVVISASAGAPSAHAERAVGLIRKLVNQKLSANGKPRKFQEKWWPMARSLVRTYNDTPMTDARAPHSPNELKRMGPAKRRMIASAMMKAGSKRVANQPGRTDPNTGAKVSKNLKILKVGDRVRYAIENIRKDGGLGSAKKRSVPKQRWSDSVHTITKVIRRKLGFANYVLSGQPRRRYEREDLQGPLT